MRLSRQLAAIAGLILCFAAFDTAIYEVFTKRYSDRSSAEMHAKSVAVSEYLPFDAQSGIFRQQTDLTLSDDLPVLDSAAALFPVCSAYVYALYPEESVKYDGAAFSAESALQFSNTRGAYQSVIDGSADVIFCAAPSAQQLLDAEAQGVTLVQVPIGREAFVFLVNAENPVDNLTVEQVQGIYTGKYTNWSQVGGENRPVDALQRNTGSGSQTAMLSFMDGRDMHRSLMSITGSPIGYSFRYYVEELADTDSGIKMLALDGIYPDVKSIADGSYPASSYFYAVYNAANANPNIPLLLDYILSDDGQTIIAESGYVPLPQSERTKN